MFKRILIVVEPHAQATAVIRTGAALAKTGNAEILCFGGLPRHPTPVVGVSDGEMPARRDPLEFVREQAERLLLAATAEAEGLGVMLRSVEATGSEPLSGILSAAQTGRCDLIIVASEGSNAVMRLLTGNVIPGLVTASPVPVIVCAPLPLSPGADTAGAIMQRILVILEDRGQAQAALTKGLNLALEHDAELLFVHIRPPDLVPVVDISGFAAASSLQLAAEFRDRSNRLLSRASTVARKAGLAARGISLPAGTTARDVARLAVDQACDLIAVSHAGSNAVMRLLTGSLIPGLITAATVPLLICRELIEPARRPAPRRRRHRHKAATAAPTTDGPPP